jgi:lipopolysaccharide/colanic/teichoic acid biosynthesis glycosyltransferase
LATQSHLRLIENFEEQTPQVAAAVRAGAERMAPSCAVVEPLGSSWYPPLKSALDRLAALLLLPLALPVVVLSALVIKLTSRGPVFYSQTRVGRHGRHFTIYKIRTMIHNCESLTGPRWSMPGDPRVTPFGWLLRISHLDELPQLWNVLRGDMSLIGPRPERPEFLPELEAALPAYRQRLAVRPGVTGLAQVQLPPDSDLDSVQRKLAFDLYYIRHLNPWLDLRLLLATGLYALGIPFRWLCRLLAIPEARAVQGAVADVMAPAEVQPRQRLSA